MTSVLLGSFVNQGSVTSQKGLRHDSAQTAGCLGAKGSRSPLWGTREHPAQFQAVGWFQQSRMGWSTQRGSTRGLQRRSKRPLRRKLRPASRRERRRRRRRRRRRLGPPPLPGQQVHPTPLPPQSHSNPTQTQARGEPPKGLFAFWS